MTAFGVKAGESEEFQTATRMVAALLVLCGNILHMVRMRSRDVCLCCIVQAAARVRRRRPPPKEGGVRGFLKVDRAIDQTLTARLNQSLTARLNPTLTAHLKSTLTARLNRPNVDSVLEHKQFEIKR